MRKPIQNSNTRIFDLINQLEVLTYEPLYNEKLFKQGTWDYVCYSHQKFITHMEEAYELLGKNNDAKFVDVGCGIGSKVHLAGQFFDSYGIELNKRYAKVARAINSPKTFLEYGRYTEEAKPKQRIFNQNALNFDYKPYDVIYFFQPLNQPKLQIQLEKRIFSTAKPGAIIVPIYAQSDFPKYIRKLPTPSDALFIKLHRDDRARDMELLAKGLFG